MNVQDLVNRARRLWYVDIAQYSDNVAIEDFNIIYQDIADTIVNLQEDYFWDYFVADMVNWQNEYTLPNNLTWDYTELYKSIWISTKYDIDSKYIKAKRTSPNNLDNDLTYYEDTQSKFSPMYHISDNSYFIYPKPTKAVTSWIKVYWIKTLKDLLITDTVLFAWKIPSKFYSIISLGMLESIYQIRWMINEANNAKQRYELAKKELINAITPRDYWIMEMTTPNLSNLT